MNDLREFVNSEHEVAQDQLFENWDKPLNKKLESGHSQLITHLEKSDERDCIWAYLDKGESRFREGDMVCLHLGDAVNDRFLKQLSIERDEDTRWLLCKMGLNTDFANYKGGKCYADTDSMDLTPLYNKSLNELADTSIGREIVLPLLAGQLNTDKIYEYAYDMAAEYADEMQLNELQIEAVAISVGAEYVACVQGPPGTGKTKVLSIIAELLVKNGETVLMTSHTHMAINNALNKISETKVPVIKVGTKSSKKGLNENIPIYSSVDDWVDRPSNGYVIGATPYATCTTRLESIDFHTVIFDEASQVTMPLAVMAMRKARKFIFIGDQKQLPPVVLSKSILDEKNHSAFGELVSRLSNTKVMLDTTYRLNQWLTQWPSDNFYESKLKSGGDNQQRQFRLNTVPNKFKDVLSPEHSLIFIPSAEAGARTVNMKDAKLISEIISEVISSGLPAEEIGVVTPFRNQAKRIRALLKKDLSKNITDLIIVDTVERMQGQEREMIILSFTATDEFFIKNISTFLFQPERLNVSITRSKTKLIIIGPKITENFYTEDSRVIRWVQWYKNITRHCKEVRAG